MHQTSFNHAIIQSFACLFYHLQQLSLPFNQIFLTLPKPIHTSLYQIFWSLFLETETQIEVSLSKSVKRRIGRVWSDKLHKGTLWHIKQKIWQYLKQSYLFICCPFNLKTHHKQCFLPKMLKVYSFWQINLVCL
jgi:hypothetical protein